MSTLCQQYCKRCRLVGHMQLHNKRVETVVLERGIICSCQESWWTVERLQILHRPRKAKFNTGKPLSPYIAFRTSCPEAQDDTLVAA